MSVQVEWRYQYEEVPYPVRLTCRAGAEACTSFIFGLDRQQSLNIAPTDVQYAETSLSDYQNFFSFHSLLCPRRWFPWSTKTKLYSLLAQE
jgi:uncharacterized protein (DUF1810 family)